MHEAITALPGGPIRRLPGRWFVRVKPARMIGPGITIVWFKRDLRIHDHVPLAEAARTGPVLPLYIVEPDSGERRI